MRCCVTRARRRACAAMLPALALPLLLTAQPSEPALVRGVLIARDTSSGDFSIRAADDQLYRYHADRRTYVERENQMIDVARLLTGEKIEVVSDRLPGVALRYARTIHVLEDKPRPRPSARRLERAIPTGDLALSGVVSALLPGRLILRTREGNQALALLPDTRFLDNGEIVDLASLKLQMRVFVRAGKDAYGRLEAYQVIWGQILDPR